MSHFDVQNVDFASKMRSDLRRENILKRNSPSLCLRGEAAPNHIVARERQHDDLHNVHLYHFRRRCEFRVHQFRDAQH